MDLSKIWVIFIAIHICLSVIHYPIFKFLEYQYKFDFDFDIYDEFWPFWSINVSIFTIYTVTLFIIKLLE